MKTMNEKGGKILSSGFARLGLALLFWSLSSGLSRLTPAYIVFTCTTINFNKSIPDCPTLAHTAIQRGRCIRHYTALLSSNFKKTTGGLVDAHQTRQRSSSTRLESRAFALMIQKAPHFFSPSFVSFFNGSFSHQKIARLGVDPG